MIHGFGSSRALNVVWALMAVFCVTSRAEDPPEGDAAPSPKDASVAAEDSGGAPPKVELPVGVIARLNGRDIAVREYADYLLASIGTARLDEYIDRLLIEEAARKAGIQATAEEVDAIVEQRIDRTIRGIYRGNRDAYLEGLEKQGTTLDDRKALLRQEVFYDTLVEKLIVKGRTVDAADIRKEYERVYGPGGVQYELRHLLVATGPRRDPEGGSVRARSEAEARERAAKIHKDLLAGADFVQLVKQYSDDTLTRQNDGRIPVYGEALFGADFHRAVLQLGEENPVSGIVQSKRGFHLIQLIRKTVTPLEDVKDQVTEEIQRRPPTVTERQQFLEELRAAATIVR